MNSPMQLVMNAGNIDDGAAFLGKHANSDMETLRDDIKSECRRMLDNFGPSGFGHDEHAQVMRKVDSLINEHINALTTHKTGMINASSTAGETGRRMRMNMGRSVLEA